MSTVLDRLLALIVLLGCVLKVAPATTVSALSFEQLVDNSDAVVSGTVARVWAEWDSEHKFIWTRSEVAVDQTHKGGAAKRITVSELGGEAEGMGMSVAGSPRYQAGERVVIFLKNYQGVGYRTMGWGQGHFHVDPSGAVHANGPAADVQLVNAASGTKNAFTPLRRIDGISLRDFQNRIAMRLQQRGAKQ